MILTVRGLLHFLICLNVVVVGAKVLLPVVIRKLRWSERFGVLPRVLGSWGGGSKTRATGDVLYLRRVWNAGPLNLPRGMWLPQPKPGRVVTSEGIRLECFMGVRNFCLSLCKQLAVRAGTYLPYFSHVVRFIFVPLWFGGGG